MNGAHQWIGLANAFMNEAQASEWVGVEGLAGDTALELQIPAVICISCGERVLDELEICTGPLELKHRWISTLTLELDTEEVAHWLGSEEMEPKRLPRSNGLTCAICGQPYEGASPECPERVLYAKEVADERDQV